MFPHPCGPGLERLVAAGADPRAVVPDDYVVVRGGTKPIPNPGTVFSCAAGPDVIAAACAVVYGKIRTTTAGQIRSPGGIVLWLPEHSQPGTMNLQHVNVTEAVVTSFGPLVPQSRPDRQGNVTPVRETDDE